MKSLHSHLMQQTGATIRSLRAGERSGATLLLVVTLLVLFTLAGTTFLVVASQYRRGARLTARIDTHVEPPKNLADDAVSVLIRGTTERSIIGPHTLLGDKYDVLQGFKVRLLTQAEETAASVTALEANADSGFHFVIVRLSSRNNVLGLGLTPALRSFAVGLGNNWEDPSATTYTLSSRVAFYSGCEATFTSGPARGVTARIVGYQVTGGIPQLSLMIERADPAVPVFPPAVGVAAFREAELVINSRPFGGLGAGVASTGGTAGAMTNQALKINRSDETPLQVVTNYMAGGTNEGYDSPDLQNVHLGATMLDASGNRISMPSFHRPALVNWYLNQIATSPVSINDITLTPFHQRPNGSAVGDGQYPWLDQIAAAGATVQSTAGPNFPTLRNPVTGPWHVDNDGDLIPDSVWMDLGFPERTAADGRRYKPLFAVMIEDLDGRLNVNAHGSAWHIDAGAGVGYALGLLPNQVVDRAGNPVPTSNLLARGQGYGPAEISLRPLYDNAMHLNLLSRRYGADGVPGSLQTNPTELERLAEMRLFEMPRVFQAAIQFTNPELRSYSSPPDLQGRFTIATGVDGMPKYELANLGVRPNELAESPYEMDLSGDATHGPVVGNPADRPYTTEELEALLRRFDVDAASLPKRLLEINPAVSSSLVTSESWDVPVPSVAAPEFNTRFNPATGGDLFNAETRTTTIVDLYTLYRGGSAAVNGAELATVFAPEVLMGLRMDLNRPFGDGRDNNLNGIVDDHTWVAGMGEAGTGEGLATNFLPAPGAPNSFIPFDMDNNGAAGDVTDYLARQHFGTHLYTLIMTLLPREAVGSVNVLPLDFDGDGNATAEETAYLVAQWVANVIDFRDADSINTPFEFDKNPFDGFGIDQDPRTDEGPAVRGLVWGMERPELLISETIAWHDQKVTNDSSSDPEQSLKPVGAAFVEVYNPWDSSTRAPAEIYDYTPGTPTGVALNRVNAAGSPVWRMAIYENDGGQNSSFNNDPNYPEGYTNPIPNAQAPNNEALDRLVYFAPRSTVAAFPEPSGAGVDPLVFCPTDDMLTAIGPNWVVGPQQYAVLGSSGNAIGGNQFESMVGYRTDAVPSAVMYSDLSPNSTRRIVLQAGTQVRIVNNNAGAPEIRNTMAIPLGDAYRNGAQVSASRRSFNVSEPRGGYDGQGGAMAWTNRFAGDFPAGETVEWIASAPDPEPLDQNYSNQNDVGLFNEGFSNEGATRRNFCFVHLQRLANPLLPYHEQTNPYLTVDSSPIDLNVFSAADARSNPTGIANLQTEFATLERGRRELGNNGRNYAAVPVDQDDLLLWRSEMVDSGTRNNNRTVSTPLGAGDHYYDFELEQSLAFRDPSFPLTNKAYFNRPLANGVVGFPYLTWNNRPFVSQLELLQVPACRQSRLGFDYSTGATQGSNLYTPTNNNFEWNGRHPAFTHLLNWFASNPQNATATPIRPEFHRLLDFVNVPTRFVGHEMYLNPTYFVNNTPATIGRHPPYNWISSYREPGRVNLNTVYFGQVWQGLNGFISNTQRGYDDDIRRPAFFGELIDSRKGWGNTGVPYEFLATSPEMFENPYRGYGAAGLQPPGLIRTTNIEATLLRSFEDFRNNTTGTTPLMQRALDANTVQPYENGVRDSFHRYDSMMRLGNLTTTRSNVYAVWITVGYFELSLESGQWVPDRELGLDDGTVKRERAFYLIDRSIPTAYEPGVDHNIDAMIRLRRRIE